MLETEIQRGSLNEIWVDVPRYEYALQVSSFGRVKSKQRPSTFPDGRSPPQGLGGVILKPSIDRAGYCLVRTTYNANRVYGRIHRWVAKAFLPNPDNYPQVNHIDGDKTNNNVNNLEWCNNSHNQIHAHELGLRSHLVGENACHYTGPVTVYKDNLVIDILKGSNDMKSKGYQPSLVYKCLTGSQKTHRGCTFKKEII